MAAYEASNNQRYALVVGNPARAVGWICARGNRIRVGDKRAVGSCEACGTSHSRTGDGVEVIAPT